MTLLDLAEYRLPEVSEPECDDCGALLTVVEFIHYGWRCEACERAWSNRVHAWRCGAPDPELDEAIR